MQKILIYTNPAKSRLLIEATPAFQFELHDGAGKLLVTGNKLPTTRLISIDIDTFPAGHYKLTLFIEGEIVRKHLEL